MPISQVVGLAAASLFLALSALAQEKKIRRSDLPPMVEKSPQGKPLGHEE